jgi:hypothetical protein
MGVTKITPSYGYKVYTHMVTKQLNQNFDVMKNKTILSCICSFWSIVYCYNELTVAITVGIETFADKLSS